MKPLHVGLLVVGAAIAGGLAVRMSQPPPPQVAASSVPVSEEVHLALPAPIPPANPQPAVTVAPAPVYEEPPPAVKRKPFPPAPQPPAVQLARAVPMPINPTPYQAPAPAPVPAAAPAPEPPPEARRVTLNQGLQISIRLNDAFSMDHTADGDTFGASLAGPLVADGLVIAERGAVVTGRVVKIQKGRFFGTWRIQLELLSVRTSDGQRVSISTEPVEGNLPADLTIRFRLAAAATITERPL